jgi:hypothetical protein
MIEINGEPKSLYLSAYSNGRIAVTLKDEDGMPYGTLSTNVPELDVREGEFILSHNCNRILGELMASGRFADTGYRADYGFIKGQPILRLVE